MTELAPPQISSLMEALPGIAAVLRSPIATAIISLSRASADLEPFQLSHAEELLRYGVRRNLLTQDEVDKVLVELREFAAKQPPRVVVVPEKVVKEAIAPKAAMAHLAKLPVGKAAPAKILAKAPVNAAAKAPAKAVPPSKAPAKPPPNAAAKVPVKPAAKGKVKLPAKKVAARKPVPAARKAAPKKSLPARKPIPARKKATRH